MTRPEPAGAGTADETRRWCYEISKTVDRWLYRGGEDIVIEAFAAAFSERIASAITAAESRAMERCAAWLDQQSEAARFSGNIFAAVAIAKLAAGLRSSINHPGEEE